MRTSSCRRWLFLIVVGRDVPVAVFSGPPDVSRPDERLNPGEQKRSGWFLRPSEVTTERFLRAYDSSGAPVFCERFALTYEGTKTRVMNVLIRKGQINC